jgi:hypothetical protein
LLFVPLPEVEPSLILAGAFGGFFVIGRKEVAKK